MRIRKSCPNDPEHAAINREAHVRESVCVCTQVHVTVAERLHGPSGPVERGQVCDPGSCRIMRLLAHVNKYELECGRIHDLQQAISPLLSYQTISHGIPNAQADFMNFFMINWLSKQVAFHGSSFFIQYWNRAPWIWARISLEPARCFG